MQMKLLSMAAALAVAFAGSAYAQQSTPSTPKRDADTPKVDRKAKNAEEERIEADAKAAKAKCEPMKGNEKDLCQAEAKAKEKVAKAELDAKYDNTPRKQRKVEETKAEADYEVAKAKCDLQGGKSDNACKKEAKAKYDRAKADIKAKHARAEQRNASTGSTKSERTK